MVASARAARAQSRRAALRNRAIFGGVSAAVVVGGTSLYYAFKGPDEVDASAEALELQRKEGWDVGEPGGSLAFTDQVAQDADGLDTWRAALDDLPAVMAPLGAAWQPFAVSTLAQVLAQPASARLRAAMRPIHSTAMDAAYGRGLALRGLFESVGWPKDTAIVVDLPGPDAVAVAAALSDKFDPVFTFDNWPHPLGVVKSHLTLGALLFHAPQLRKNRAVRTPGEAPAFVLDRNRLAPYKDEPGQFDNRYLAKLPSPAVLKAQGIKHILYVTPDERQLKELDDLNEEMVAFDRAGVDVKIVPLTEFKEESPADQAASAALLANDKKGGAAGAGGTTTQTVVHRHYYYGGSPGFAYYYFWSAYMWYPAPRVMVMPGRSGGFRGPAPTPPPRPMPGGAGFRPSPRPTMFSSRTVGGVASGVGKQKPSGFGRVSYKASPATGRFVGGHFARSGSFGRARGGTSA
jgi:hypothetical protein